MIKKVGGLTEAQTKLVRDIGLGYVVGKISNDEKYSTRTARTLVRRSLIEYHQDLDQFKLTATGQRVYGRIVRKSQEKLESV